MADNLDVFVFASQEVQALLADNGTELVALLTREGAQVQATYRKNPGPETEGKRDVAVVLLASAAVIAALTPLLTRALSRLTQKRVLVREKILFAVEDAEGKVVRDAAGNPRYYWTYRTEIIESTPDANFAAKVMGHGVEISIGELAKK